MNATAQRIGERKGGKRGGTEKARMWKPVNCKNGKFRSQGLPVLETPPRPVRIMRDMRGKLIGHLFDCPRLRT